MISREGFVKALNSVMDGVDREDRICRALYDEGFGEIIPVSYANPVFEVLAEVIVGTPEGDEFDAALDWIDYFCWEVDFGRDYKPGCVTDQDDNPIDISSAGKLYDYMVSQIESGD